MNSQTAARIAPVVILVFALTSCASNGGKDTVNENPKAILGGVLGAGAGAGIAVLAGGGTGWIVAGALAGGLLGGVIGHKLDERDKEMAAKTAATALESNQTGASSQWTNPDSGNSGTFTPTRTYQQADGRYCREYKQEIMVDDEKHQAHGTACRQPDGSWKLES